MNEIAVCLCVQSELYGAVSTLILSMIFIESWLVASL